MAPRMSIMIVVLPSEGRYWKKQSRRYGEHERKFTHDLVLHFTSPLILSPFAMPTLLVALA